MEENSNQKTEIRKATPSSKGKKRFGKRRTDYADRRSGSKSKAKNKTDKKIITATKKQIDHLSLPFDKARFCIFDIETTGGNPEKNGITEIFAINYDYGEPGDTFYSLVNPGVGIPPIVRKMTGITNAMVKNEPPIDDVMPKFLEFLEDRILVSHNTIGDMKFLSYFALKACGKVMDHFYVCTHLQVEKLIPEAKDKSLSGVAKYFGVDTGHLHRAEADGYLTLEVFKNLCVKLKEVDIHNSIDAIRLQGDFDSGMRLGWAVDTDKLSSIPKKPGVFLLKDRLGKVEFASSAVNLSKDIAKLKRLDQLPRQLLKIVIRTYDIEYITCNGVFEASLLEAQYLTENDFNFFPGNWHQRTLNAVYFKNTGSDYFVGIGRLEQGAEFSYGPIVDRKLIMGILDEFAKIFHLKSSRKELHLNGHIYDILRKWFDESSEVSERLEASLAKGIRVLTRIAVKIFQVDRRRLISKIPQPSGIHSLFHYSGIVVVRSDEESRLTYFYPIIKGRVGELTEIDVPWNELRSDKALSRKIVRQISLQSREINPYLSKLEAARSNAFLWWMHSYYGRQSIDARFVSVEKLKKK